MFQKRTGLTQLTDALYIRIEETLPSDVESPPRIFIKVDFSATVGADQAVTVAAID